MILMECSYGSFSRSFTLPPEAYPDKVNAHCENGILSVMIPKEPKPEEEEEEARKIEIQ
jgi:HSP20 family protein